MLEKILQWDRDAFIYLNSLGIEEYDGFWSVFTNFYTWIPLFLFFVYLFFTKFPKRKAWGMICTVLLLMFLITTVTTLTKEFVARLRPNNQDDLNTLIRILKTPTNYSFFSGHAASSFSMTTLVFLLVRSKFKWAWLFFIWPLLFSLSRIYVGVHYPSDIIVGAMVGIGMALLVYIIYKRFIVPYLRSGHP